MKRTTKWDRIADRWRIQLPVPRYLRHFLLRAVRERVWFMSRLQPKIDVTVNLTNSLRNQTLGSPPSTVFLHRWLTERNTDPEASRQEARASMPRLGLPLTRMSPLAKSRTEQKSASLVGLVGKSALASQAVIKGYARVTRALTPRLVGRTRRIDDMTPAGPSTRVVKRSPASAVSEAISSSREAPGWGEPRRGFPRGEPGFVPVPAAALPAPVNVEQLTDQVLRHLDRRLIASRERLGRI